MQERERRGHASLEPGEWERSGETQGWSCGLGQGRHRGPRRRWWDSRSFLIARRKHWKVLCRGGGRINMIIFMFESMVAVNGKTNGFETDLGDRVYQTWWLPGLVALQKTRVSPMTSAFWHEVLFPDVRTSGVEPSLGVGWDGGRWAGVDPTFSLRHVWSKMLVIHPIEDVMQVFNYKDRFGAQKRCLG